MAEKRKSTENWCESRLKVIKTTFLWTIDNFSYRPERTGEHIKSSVFSDSTHSRVKWYLELLPNGEDEESEDYISLYLQLESSDRKEVSAKFRLSIIDANGEETHSKKSFYRFDINNGYGYRRFVQKSVLTDGTNGLGLLFSDELTIYCEIGYTDGYYTTNGFNYCKKLCPEADIVSDLTALYVSEKGADVVLVVGKHQMKAHKAILTARSPVFSAMFDHQLEENKSNRVEINDMNHRVVKEMLRFIYTGNVLLEWSDYGMDLLVAADKYNLPKLKSICENFMISELTVESVSNILILADMHSADDLKARAIEFIKNNSIEVTKTIGWERLVRRRPTIISEFFRLLFPH